MIRTGYDFSAFRRLDQTEDGAFITGEQGVTAVLAPADNRSEFLFFGERIFVRLKSGLGDPVLYPLTPPSFCGPAKAVLMDLDGTSVLSEEFWIWIIQQTMRELMGAPAFSLEEADLPFVSGFSVSEHLQYCIGKYAPGMAVEEARRRYYAVTARAMDEVLHGRGNTGAFHPAPHLKEFLTALKKAGVKIGLVTSGLYNKAMPEIVAAFRTMGMGDPLSFYDAIITAGTAYIPGVQSGTLGELCAKPHPWPYAEVAKVGLALSKEDQGRVIGIEDSSAGVLSVALAGYPVAGMERGNIQAAGLDGLLCRRCTDLMELANDIL